MKILHISSGLDRGGAERLLYDVASEINTRGHEVRVLNLFDPGCFSISIKKMGIPVVDLELSRQFPWHPVSFAKFIFNLARLGREVYLWRPDLIQTWMYPADIIGGLLGRTFSIPVIWGIFSGRTDAAIYKPKMYRLIRLCARLSRILPTYIISCSAFGRRSHIDIGYPKGKVLFIPIGIRSHQKEASRPERSEEGSTKIIRIGMLARFAPEKNHTALIGACSQLIQAGFPIHLSLAGGSGITPRNPVLTKAIADHRMSEFTTLHGTVPHPDDFFSQIDIFCLLSYSEGFPTVVLEAMRAGLPCAVSDVGDAKGILSDMRQIVEDQSSTLQVLENLCLLNAEARTEIGIRNQMRIFRYFPAKRMIERFEDVYSAATSHRLSYTMRENRKKI